MIEKKKIYNIFDKKKDRERKILITLYFFGLRENKKI